MPVTVLMAVFNEERRLRRALKGASLWTDDIILLDKGSTDGTLEIAAEFSQCRVISIPFSQPGEENTLLYVGESKHDWHVALTPGEQPTRDMADFFQNVSDENCSETDVFQIPVKIMSFGAFTLRGGPWSISYQTRLWHRRRVQRAGEIHFPWKLTQYSRRLNFKDSFYLLHCTHNGFDSFVNKHQNYAKSEASLASDKLGKARASIEKAKRHDVDFLVAGEPGLRAMVAWKAYNYLVALACLTHDLPEEKVIKIYEGELDKLLLGLQGLNTTLHKPFK